MCYLTMERLISLQWRNQLKYWNYRLSTNPWFAGYICRVSEIELVFPLFQSWLIYYWCQEDRRGQILFLGVFVGEWRASYKRFISLILKNYRKNPGMVVHTCHSSTGEVEAGRSGMHSISRQPGLLEALSRKTEPTWCSEALAGSKMFEASLQWTGLW